MAFSVTDFGTGAVQSGAGGNNATATVTSASRTFVAGELVAVLWGTVRQTATTWTIASVTPSGGALGALTVYESPDRDDNPAGGGYLTRSVIGICQVTTGFTGTITATRTAGTVDHWEVARFLAVSGHDSATPVLQSASNAQQRSSAGGSLTTTATFASAPASTSLILTAAMVNALGNTFTGPSGHDVVQLEEATSWGAHFGASYLVGSGTQANAWVSSGAHSGLTTVAVEIALASGGGGAVIDPNQTDPRSWARFTPGQWIDPPGFPRPPLGLTRAGGNPPALAAVAQSAATRIPAQNKPPAGLFGRSPAARRPTPPAFNPASTEPSFTPSGLWPTTVAAGGRYLKDQNGNAWQAWGDTAWCAITQLVESEIDTYLSTVAAKGVNAVVVELVEHFFSTNAPNNIDGQAAWTGTAFQSPLNDTYWRRARYFVGKASSLGITVLAAPCYFGFAATSEGWNTELAAASNGDLQTYGGYLGAMFKGYPNLVWVAGGDRNPDATLAARMDACVTGIKAAGDTHLWTAHCARGVAASAQWDSYSWLDIDTSYVGTSPVADTFTLYAAQPPSTTTRPILMVEGYYEVAGSYTRPLGHATTLGAALAGGLAGYMWGSEDVWDFTSGVWPSALSTVGYADQDRINDVLAGRAWATLRPDNGTLVTAGLSSGATRAAPSYDTTTALVYVQTTGSITLDLTQLSGTSSVLVRWWDPTAGSYTTVGTYSTSGSQTISHPGSNSAGGDDWLLVVEPASGTPVVALAPFGWVATAAAAVSVPAAASSPAGWVATAAAAAAPAAVASLPLGFVATGAAQVSPSAVVTAPWAALVSSAAALAMPATAVAPLAWTAWGVASAAGDVAVVASAPFAWVATAAAQVSTAALVSAPWAAVARAAAGVSPAAVASAPWAVVGTALIAGSNDVPVVVLAPFGWVARAVAGVDAAATVLLPAATIARAAAGVTAAAAGRALWTPTAAAAAGLAVPVAVRLPWGTVVWAVLPGEFVEDPSPFVLVVRDPARLVTADRLARFFVRDPARRGPNQ